MRIRQAGNICDHLWLLGQQESGVYFLEGTEETMIISGGMSYIVPTVLQQVESFGLSTRKLTKLLILHSHFDHVGIIPYFKRSYPDLEIVGSGRAREILEMEKAIKTINAFSRSVAERMGMTEQCDAYDLDWRNDINVTPIHDGDVIDLGELQVRILETPGHSSCAISAYVPKIKALFPTDCGGIPFRETIICSGNSNYTRYQESLQKLSLLEVDYYCPDHYGYVRGEEARGFVEQSMRAAADHRRKMEDCYRRTGEIDAAAKEMTDAVFADYPEYFLSREIFEGVYRQMIKHIAEAMDTGD